MFKNSTKRTKNIPVGWKCNGAGATGEELDEIEERLKKLKLTFRNVPNEATAVDGNCIFTGKPAVEQILIGKAY